MNTKSLIRRTSKKFLALSFCLLAGGSLASAQAADKYASSGGDWNSLTWEESGTATTTPSSADFANIGNGFNVDLAGSGTTGRLRIGSTLGGMTATGTFTLASGTMGVGSSGSLAVHVGYSDNSTATMNVNGGFFETYNSGWLLVGGGDGSVGTVNLTSGTMAISSYVVLAGVNAVGASATGNINVSGGHLNMTDSASDMHVGRVASGTNTGNFVQTSGTTTIGRSLRIGNNSLATGTSIGTFVITGGQLDAGGDIRIGPTGSGSGSGSMTFGSEVDFVASAGTNFDVSGNGEIVFQLGADDSFDSINLTASTETNVMSFDSGATITIDGTNLVFSSGYDPIDLFTFGSGQGPTALSQSNVVFDYIGFDPGFAPSLAWTDTSLQLTLIPEPSVIGLIAFASVLGLARRRRRTST